MAVPNAPRRRTESLLNRLTMGKAVAFCEARADGYSPPYAPNREIGTKYSMGNVSRYKD